MKSCFVIAVMLLALPTAASRTANAQSSIVGTGCDLVVFGEKDTKVFSVFDHDLRNAIEKRDVSKLAVMVQFPLRVTDDRGIIFIHDARSLQGYFDQIFTPAIRQSILSSTHDTIGCNYAGIEYGDGRVWINVTDKGYFVMTVNLPKADQNNAAVTRTVAMACHTDELRIAVDVAQDGAARFRAWRFGRSLSESPDRVMERGKESFEGTGPCAHRVWAFQTDKEEILLSEPGCYGDADGPPPNAQAQLVISEPGDASHSRAKIAWCF